jgi:CII-binding regulator of phage lambda lysogenization HflD
VYIWYRVNRETKSNQKRNKEVEVMKKYKDCIIDIYGNPCKVLHLTKDELVSKFNFSEEQARTTLGAYRYRDSKIALVTDYITDKTMLKTFTHEITHAIYIIFGYHQEVTKFDQEFLCDFMACHIEEINRLVNLYKSIQGGNQ